MAVFYHQDQDYYRLLYHSLLQPPLLSHPQGCESWHHRGKLPIGHTSPLLMLVYIPGRVSTLLMLVSILFHQYSRQKRIQMNTNEEWSVQLWTHHLRNYAQRSLKKIQDINGVWTLRYWCDALTNWELWSHWYWKLVNYLCSYVPVKEMNVIDVCENNKS